MNKLHERLQVFLRSKTGEVGTEEQKEKSWQIFYQKFFNIDLDISSIRIPERKLGFDRLIVVADGLTIKQVYDVCAKHFPCFCYTDDLDKAITKDDRDFDKGSYAIWIRDRVEADKELKRLSAYQIRERGILGITLLERLIFEVKYFSERGEHLDIENWTLCSGTHDSDGLVPYVFWWDGRLRVGMSIPGGRHVFLRARATVS